MNRQCYYADINNDKDKITAVASVDMNDLKKINDSQGHAEGDKALYTVATCLVQGNLSKKHIYRVGGDEFVILVFRDYSI